MKFRSIITLFLVLSFMQMMAQNTGDFFMTHFEPQDEAADFKLFDLETDKNGLLWISTNYGVFTYDGMEWDFYETPSAAVSLAVSDDNVVYVGCVGEVGKIGFKESVYGYQSIVESDTLSDIFFDALAMDNKLFFLGSNNLVSIDSKDQFKVTSGEYTNFFISEKGIVVNEVDKTYFLNEDGNSGIPERFENTAFTFGKDIGKNISVTFDGQLIEDNKPMLHNSLLDDLGVYPSEAAFVNDSLFVLTTMDKGALFFNYYDTSYVKEVDYFSGLPDNEIFSLHVDGQKGVWLAHEFGLTRVLPLFPAYSYSNLPGLGGNLLESLTANNRLWVASSLGVFYYNQDTTYKTKVYYEVKKQPVKSTPKPKPAAKKTENEEDDEGFLGSIFNKKKRAKKDNIKSKANGFFNRLSNNVEDIFTGEGGVDRIFGKKKDDVEYIRLEEKIPVKISYEFNQVEGTNGKFQNLFEYQDKLIGVSNTGLYEIGLDNSTQVVDDAVRRAEVTNNNKILVYTYSEEIALYELDDNVWIELWRKNLNDALLNIYCDRNNDVWLSGSENLFKSELTDSSLVLTDVYQIENQFFDKIEFIETEDGRLWIVNSNGVFHFDKEKNEFVEDKQIMEQVEKVVTELKDNLGNIWIYNGKSWMQFDKKGNITPYEYLSLFPNLRSLSYDSISGEYWIITEDNRLLTYNIKESVTLQEQHDLFVKKVQSNSGSYQSKEKFTLDYAENFLSVNLSQPDYTGLLKPMYQYKLKGLNSSWSDWTNNNVIDFSYIPPGSYKLDVRTRDNFGRVSEYSLLDFRVKTPYWKQPWFYALQVVFFAGLVIVSSRLNQSNTSNRLLSEGLTILTIILVIEFLQSVISSYFTIQSSPVIDFALDATVALCIFPLERLLKIFIKQGDSKMPLKISNLTKISRSKPKS